MCVIETLILVPIEYGMPKYGWYGGVGSPPRINLDSWVIKSVAVLLRRTQSYQNLKPIIIVHA